MDYFIRFLIACVDGAGHAIVRCRGLSGLATGLRVAPLFAVAEKAIAAIEGIRPHRAGSVDATVAHGAGVAIVARRLIECENASLLHVARIVGAGIVIFAHNHFGGGTGSVLADRHAGAGVAIVALGRVGCKDATDALFAPIVGAGIAVVAGKSSLTRLARTVNATVAERARVVVGALQGVTYVHASRLRVARIRRAQVVIVATQAFRRHTGTALANGGTRASVPVVTLKRVGRKDAVTSRAGFVGARIPIVA